MTPIKLPFVNSVFRYGRYHYQFRRGDIRQTLKGRPGSSKWYKHYAELLAQSEEAAKPVSGPARPGTIDAVIIRYAQIGCLQATGADHAGGTAAHPRSPRRLQDAERSPLWAEPHTHDVGGERYRRACRQAGTRRSAIG